MADRPPLDKETLQALRRVAEQQARAKEQLRDELLEYVARWLPEPRCDADPLQASLLRDVGYTVCPRCRKLQSVQPETYWYCGQCGHSLGYDGGTLA